MSNSRKIAFLLHPGVIAGVWVVGLGVLAGATVASAVEYNATEAAGLTTQAPPVWIASLGVVGVALLGIALVLTVTGIARAVLRSRAAMKTGDRAVVSQQ